MCEQLTNNSGTARREPAQGVSGGSAQNGHLLEALHRKDWQDAVPGRARLKGGLRQRCGKQRLCVEQCCESPKSNLG